MGVIRRPLLPISHVSRVEVHRCPGCHKESTCESSRDEPLHSVDEFGGRMLGCKSSLPTRTRLWYGPLVEVWLVLARMAGLSCGKEVRNLMLHSSKWPDVAIPGALRSIIADVRTVIGADPRHCAAAALFPGHGAVWGAARKNGAWLCHTMPEGGAFFALCHEAGGHMKWSRKWSWSRLRLGFRGKGQEAFRKETCGCGCGVETMGV